MLVPDPTNWLAEFQSSNRYTRWRWWTEHGKSGGRLEQSVLTGAVRSRYQFDHKWTCERCRPYKEESEGGRLVEAFQGNEMWLDALVGDRDEVHHLALEADASYVCVPAGGPYVVLSTRPIGPSSVAVTDPDSTVRWIMGSLRWEGSLSSSRGFLPPARTYTHWETYHPTTKRRCWELHDSQEDARQCEWPVKWDGSRKGWYVRGTSEWHDIGRVGVKGDDLVVLVQQSHLGWRQGDGLLTEVELDPVTWDNPRFQEFLQLAEWVPPHEDFQPPPLTIRVTVDPKSGRLKGQRAV